ncbi:MAG: hypothetical protein D3925_17625 [Candidatus Electrothrix sp. AR5]|nr:hypothetical protein [Candidatus Electrothrix sp. AR5]
MKNIFLHNSARDNETATRKTSEKKRVDAFESTCGSWKRSESPDETVHQARAAFKISMERHQR